MSNWEKLRDKATREYVVNWAEPPVVEQDQWALGGAYRAGANWEHDRMQKEIEKRDKLISNMIGRLETACIITDNYIYRDAIRMFNETIRQAKELIK